METPSGESAPKFQTVTAYLLKQGNRFRLSLDDAPDAEGWEAVERHTIYVDASIDLDALRREVDRLCEKPLTAEGVTNLLADLRGQVLLRPHTKLATQRKYAESSDRLCAWFVDFLIFAPIQILFFAGYHSAGTSSARLLTVAAVPVVYFIYRIAMHVHYGQTLGKMACGIVVRNVSEEPLSIVQSTRREIVDVILWACFFQLAAPALATDAYHSWLSYQLTILFRNAWRVIDFIVTLTNFKRRSVHDFISGSVVLRKL